MKSSYMSKFLVLTYLLVLSLLAEVTQATDQGNLLDEAAIAERSLTRGREENEGKPDFGRIECSIFCSNNRPPKLGKQYPFPAFSISCPKEAPSENGTYKQECRRHCEHHCPSMCTDTTLNCEAEKPFIDAGEVFLYLFLFIGLPLLCCCGCIAFCIVKRRRRERNNYGMQYNGEMMPVVQPEPVAVLSTPPDADTMEPQPNTMGPPQSPA